MLDPQKISKCKADLLEVKERLIREITRLEETGIGDAVPGSAGELSLDDYHPGGLGDDFFEWSKDAALRDNAHILLEEVEEALTKMIDETYGLCSKCGREISPERLEALPWTNHCLACQLLEGVNLSS